MNVSVILLTFNQYVYLERAIESVLMQVFSGKLFLYIFDDFSSDNTVHLLSHYQTRFPDLIKVFRNERNLGLARNWEKAYSLVDSAYIAYLEGDDYWTDPLKIQKQFDALEANPKYSLSFHDFVYVDKDSNLISDSNLNKESLKMDRCESEMISGCLIHQNTIMYRKYFKRVPSWFFLAKNHDTWLIAYLSNFGPSLYTACEPLHYRIVDHSLWSSLSPRRKHFNGFITTLMIFPIAPLKYYPILFRKLGSKVYQLIRLVLK